MKLKLHWCELIFILCGLKIQFQGVTSRIGYIFSPRETLQNSFDCVLEVSPDCENIEHETSRLEPQSQREKNSQASVPGADGPSGAMGDAGRAHCPVLPGRSYRQAPLFFVDDAAHPIHAAMVHAVLPGHGRGVFRYPA